MTPESVALWGLAVSIVGLAAVLFFKGPKEIAKELADRLELVERDHSTVERTVTEHTVELRHLAKACEGLAIEVTRLREAIIGKFQNDPPRRGR